MVVNMSSGRVSRYKEEAKAEMIRCNRSQIRCPCRNSKLESWIDPDSGQLEDHLLRRGFMLGLNEAPTANGAHEDEGGRGEDEESPGHGYQDEGDVGGQDGHDEGVDGGGEDANTQNPLMSALQDSHVQELFLKETSNVRAAAREKAKLAQMEIDGKTPLYPGCRPQDTRLQVTLDALEMKAENRWTDVSFTKNLKFMHDRLPEGNTLPTSIEDAKKVMCPLDLPYVKYHACINDCAIYRGEYKDITTCPVCGQGRYKSTGPRKFLEKWYGTFLSLPVCSGTSWTVRKQSSCNGTRKGRSPKKIRRRAGS